MKKIKFELEERDGNAFMLIGAFTKEARKQGWTPEEISSFRNEAMAGDYDNLLRTIMKYSE